MGTLWLYALPLDEVRAFFAAPAELADQLLTQAEAVTHKAAPSNLIGKVGPLFKHPVFPVIDLPGPTTDDAQCLVEGRSVAPDRLDDAWVIVRHWCEIRAVDHMTLDIDHQLMDELDFRLVSRGLSSKFSLQTVLARDPRLPLRPAPGLTVGWMPDHHVAQAAEQWRDAVAQCDVPTEGIGALRDQLAQFFARSPSWLSDDASAPDVLALYQQ